MVTSKSMKTDAMLQRFIYCHGLPGSTAEFGAVSLAPEPRADIVGIDWIAAASGARSWSPSSALTAFDDAVSTLDQPATLVGFSLGAMAALQIAGRRPARVGKLVLISPAAPLELGDFLGEMAGHIVFETARAGALPFAAPTAFQGAFAAINPDGLIAGMFSNCGVAERRLLARPEFRSALVNGLNTCLRTAPRAYGAAVGHYVRPWADVLAHVRCPVAIWHGDEDRWAPLAMSQALVAALPGGATLRVSPGDGHYSTLHAVLPGLLDAESRP